MIGDSEKNKYSKWVITIQAVKGHQLPGEQTVLRVFKTLTEKYLFQLEQATSLHYQGCFQTRIRKRKQTVINEFVAELDIPRSMVVIDPMQGTWEQAKAYCSKEESGLGKVFSSEVLYSGTDITLLDDTARRYPWQSSIIKKLIDEDTNSVKNADDRSIVWVEDPKGGNGKSKLVKWCCCNFNDIVKISFGTSNQLRSAIIAAGPRRAYFIDVPRTLGSDDSMASMMSAVEDLKNGFVVSAMYGKNQSLVLDPPHIVLFSNQPCPKKYMSNDRWELYIINREKELYQLPNEFGELWEPPSNY